MSHDDVHDSVAALSDDRASIEASSATHLPSIIWRYSGQI
jgi:hypothetical protein